MPSTGLDEIIDLLWVHPNNAEWTPKVKVIPGDAFRQWMASEEIEILGFVYSMLDDHRFRVDPELSLDEYLEFIRRYYERCFFENPNGKWSDSRYSAGWDLVNVLAFHWNNQRVPRSVMEDWKIWLAGIYKRGSEQVQTCIVNATLEHLFEQGAFRKFFADWLKDPILSKAYKDALLWYEGGGRTDMGETEAVKPFAPSQFENRRIRKR